MGFSFDSPIIQQTITNNEPKVRVLLDDSILLMPVSVSESEIKLTLDTTGIPDLYLMGSHKITIVCENYFTDTLIKVGKPDSNSDLAPRINSVEVIRNERNKATNLRLIGKNFMLFPKFYYSEIDGAFGFGYQTEVIQQDDESYSWETIVRVPNPDTFDNNTTHKIIFSTPFGTAVKSF